MMETTRPLSTLYGEVADRVLVLIEQGTYKAGDKVPSIRSLSTSLGVSVNTVKEAYILLESQRFLEARPQSGYYVRRKVPPLPAAGKATPPLAKLNPMVSSICRIYGEITQNRADVGASSLAVAIPDPAFLPMAGLNRAFAAALKDGITNSGDYLFGPGYEALRTHVARHSIESGLTLSPDDIIITAGASEAISLSILALCKPGETVVVETPTYFNFLSFLEEMGIKVLEIPSSAEEGMNLDILSWALDMHEVKAVIAIPNFNNPLGSRMSDERKKRLVEMLERKKVPLIEDDIYGELQFSGKRPLTCKSFDKTGNVILVSSFSKTLASGYRVGWVVAGRFQEKIDRLKSIYSIASATPSQMAISRYLDTGLFDRHLRSLRQRLADQVGIMAETVAEVFPDGTKVSRPAGGFVLWVELPESIDTMELYSRALNEGIVFSPGLVFSASGAFGNCMRLNAGIWNPKIQAALLRLGQLARA